MISRFGYALTFCALTMGWGNVHGSGGETLRMPDRPTENHAETHGADSRLIDDVLISDWNDCSFIQIRFAVPVNYNGHTPVAEGRELNIKFKAIKTQRNEWRTVFERRAIALPSQDVIPLVELVYEKDFDGHRKLVFSFSRPISFIAGQGEDLQLLTVSIAEPDATPCPLP